MKRTGVLAAAFAVLVASCFGGEDESAADRFHALATAGDTVSYEATYRLTMSGPLAEGVRTRLRVVQDPPASMRFVQTTTQSPEGEPVSLEQWIVQLQRGSYSCTRYEADEVLCTQTPPPSSFFGLTLVDEFFELARSTDAFEAVEEDEAVRIGRFRASCFKARPEADDAATPMPSPTPRFVPERYLYEFCYTDTGILLRARRTIAGEVPAELEDRRELLLEATGVSLDVEPGAIELPGEVRSVDDLRSRDG